MTGINDLVHEWETDTLVPVDEGVMNEVHAERVRRIAATAWRDTVCDPPGEEDGDAHHRVLVRRPGRSQHDIALLTVGSDLSRFEQWARIRDVLLLPEEQ